MIQMVCSYDGKGSQLRYFLVYMPSFAQPKSHFVAFV
jgi:hypothetical protein